jgi:hypothetical protein
LLLSSSELFIFPPPIKNIWAEKYTSVILPFFFAVLWHTEIKMRTVMKRIYYSSGGHAVA